VCYVALRACRQADGPAGRGRALQRDLHGVQGRGAWPGAQAPHLHPPGAAVNAPARRPRGAPPPAHVRVKRCSVCACVRERSHTQAAHSAPHTGPSLASWRGQGGCGRGRGGRAAADGQIVRGPLPILHLDLQGTARLAQAGRSARMGGWAGEPPSTLQGPPRSPRPRSRTTGLAAASPAAPPAPAAPRAVTPPRSSARRGLTSQATLWKKKLDGHSPAGRRLDQRAAGHCYRGAHR
jgi:hypothetical protein